MHNPSSNEPHRIVGDRFPAPVKTAILHTLGLLIAKAGQHLKQFLPPLQTAFVKTLYDPAPVVRVAGARALAQLMTLTPKLEPLLNEMFSSFSLFESLYFVMWWSVFNDHQFSSFLTFRNPYIS